MFTGDRSGEWLIEALYHFGFANQPLSLSRNDGLALHDCLITATLRCAPPDNRPLPQEIDNCSEYLLQEFRLLRRRRVVLALGGIAFRAALRVLRQCGYAVPRPAPRFCHGGEWPLGDGVTVISCYHPSQQNTLTGKLTRPMFYAVFRRAAFLVRAAGNP
jgi:uracil-DNA glycosylase family 4